MKKRIFFIVNNLSGGGAERVISIISNYLIKQDYQVTILMLRSDKCVYALDPSIKLIKRENVKDNDALNQIKFIRNWYKKEPDAVFVSFLRKQNLYSLMASIGLNVKFMFSERANPDVKFEPLNKDYIELSLLKKFSVLSSCKKIVFQTQGAANCYPVKSQKKSEIIPNPLNEISLPVYKGERKKTICAVGRLTGQKNYRLLIDAFAQFSKPHPDYKLEIYGDGGLRKTMENYIDKLGLTDKIELCGFCKDVHQRIADAGMYVMSSDFEGLSNAMLEAMALGLPVISTDHPPGGARAYIKSYENGILTPVGDVDAMAKAMCYMAENPQKAKEMGLKASSVRQELSMDSICKKWKKVFDEIAEVKE